MALRTHSHILIYNSIDKVQSYWDAFKPQHPNSDNNYVDKWLMNTDLFDAISFQSHVCVTLWDVISNRFIYAADKTNVLGDTANYLLDESGVDYSISKFHPEHLEAVLTFQKRGIEFCLEHRELLPNNVSLNLDTLYEKNGSYIQVLQQGIPVETDNNNHPVLYLSFIYDISHLKKYNTANFAITTPENTFLYTFSFETKNAHEVKPLTSSEKAILKMLGEGKTTKQIAAELSVSPYTIDTHRGNMLTKTNCVDTTALVTYCRRVGIL
jgi:DNA-binding CsgD family transcriptional regulator